MKIPIKKYIMDESLSWEDKYKQLEKHHKEETAYLIKCIENLENKIKIYNFKERLQKWEDFDGTEFALAQALGILPVLGLNETEEWIELILKKENKGMFWSNNPDGNLLTDILQLLKERGILEFNEEECQYRWNNSYKAKWDL